MARNVNALYRLLAENVDFLLYESEASDQAKELNLIYAGFGYWKDQEGHVVARTLDGKLVKLEPGDKPNPEELEPKDYEPDEEPKPAGGDQLASPKSPEKALGKLIASLVDFVGLDAGYPGVTKGMAKAVIFTLASGDVPNDHVLRQLIDLPIYDEEWESIKEYLGVIANNKNSALVKALRDFLALKPAKNPNEEAEKATTEVLMEIPPELFKQMPAHVVEKYAKVIQKALYQTKGGWGADLLDGAKEAGIMALGLGKINGIVHQLILQKRQETLPGHDDALMKGFQSIASKVPGSGVQAPKEEPKPEPQEPETSEQDKFANFIYGAAGIIGIDPAHPKWDAFTDLLRDKMWKATTSTQINYARALLKKSGLLGSTEEIQWDNWKKILKTFKKDKQVASGPKNPGKIKNKKTGEPVAAPTEPTAAPAPEPTPAQSVSMTDKEAQSWFYSLPEPERLEVRDVVLGWTADLDKQFKDFGGLGVQGEISKAVYAALKTQDTQEIQALIKSGVLTPEEGKSLVGNIANFAVQQKLAPKLAPDAAPETPIFDISKLDPKWNRIPKTAQVAIQKAPPQVQQSVVDILHQAGDITETWELNDLLIKINQLSLGQEARDSLSLAVDTDFKSKMDAKDAEKKKQQSIEKQSIETFDQDVDTFGKMYQAYQSGGAVPEQPVAQPEPAVGSGASVASGDDVTTLGAAMTPMDPAEFGEDLQNVSKEIIDIFEKDQGALTDQQKGHISKAIQSAITMKGSHADVIQHLEGFLSGNMGLGDMKADQIGHMVYNARLKKEKNLPMSSYTEKEPDLKSVEDVSAEILNNAFVAGGLSPDDFTASENANAMDSIKQAISVASSDDAKKWLKNIQKELHLSKTEYDSMYAAVFKKRAEKLATDIEGTNPFADIDPPPQAIKGLEKNMTGWAKGDADKVIGWIKKKIAEDPAKSKFLKWQAAGLGKYYGVPLEKLADILPDEIKDKVTQASTQPSNAYAPEIETATGDFEKFINQKLSPEDKKHILDALTVAKNTKDPSYLDSLFTSTDLSNTQISALKDILAGETPDAVTPEGPIAKKGEEPKVPEVPKHSTKDAVGYTKATLNNVGVDFAKLKPEDQKALLDAVKGALNANDEFGVVYFMNQLKTDASKNKKGLDLSTDVIDELTFQILSDKEQEGDLDTDPDAFKKYLDPSFAVQEFLDKHQQFRDQLTPEMREKLFNAAKVGLSYTGKDGYAKAKAYYQDNLVGQIPGFDDQIFHDWRHGLKDFHDNLKNSTASIEQKKQELIAKKKAEHELKAALEKLGKGDMAQQVNSLISAAGLQDIPSNDKLAVQIAITKALDAPTSQDMMDQLDLIQGELAYGHHGSFDDDVAKMHSKKIKSVDSGKFNMLKKLVASQYKSDQDKYEPENEPTAKEHSKDRAKRVLRNWLTNSNYGIHHFPATHHSEKQAVWNTVQKALQETDPKKVNSILNDLHTTTSINDKQIAALKQAVQHERQNPEGNNGAPLPDANIKKHGVEQKVQQAISSGSVTYEKFKNSTEMKKLLTKYGTNQLTNKDNVEGLVIGSLARNTDTEYEKKLLAAALKKALTNNGMDEQHAKNLANFVARESHKKSPLYALAKAAWESKNAGNTSVTPTATKGGKEMLAQLTHTQDPHNFARNEWVPGEQVKVSTSLKWEGNSHADSANANKYAEAQDQWRNKHLNPEDNKKFNWAADSWQATGQWGQDPNRRKAMLDIFTKTIEGPPPMLTKVDNFVERGLDVKAGDFADFIAAFQVGKKVYISPQGFSSNTSTPRGMAESYNGVGVLLRVKPNKNGVLKAGRVAYRSAHHMHGGEQELVVGTSDLQVSKVTKHVVTSGGEVKTYYEIEMQYDEELKEGVQTVNGFRPELWKGVPRNTVKMLIKYGGPLPRPKK